MKQYFWRRGLAFVMVFVIFSAPQIAHAKVLKEIVQHTAGDIKYTFGSWPVLVIAGGAVVSGLLIPVDDNLQNNFSGGRKLGEFDSVAAVAGAFYVQAPAALAVYGVGKMIHNEDVAFTGETLLESLLLTHAVTAGLKLAVRRTRPNGGHYSFPSSHAAGTFSVASVLQTMHGPAYGVPAFLAAGLISFSRIDSNAHHLSDVVFGAALGAAVGWGTARFHVKEDRHIFMTPVVGKDTVGLNVFREF